MENHDLPYVFRSDPHHPIFQAFTEARPHIAREFDPEIAAVLYFDEFLEADVFQPPPKRCVFIERSKITCGCGNGLYSRAANLCDACSTEYFASIVALSAADPGGGRKSAPVKQKEPPAPKGRTWRPPAAPKVRQTWKKSGKGTSHLK